MDASFFTNQWSVPSHRQYYYSPSPVPIHRNLVPPRPKVVSIPVRSIDTERTQADSALKIQSLYRGYLVRKSLKRIAAIGKEVDEIQRRVEDAEFVDLMRRDSRERLKVNERLMDFLFRLDSVRGVDSGVREYRKKAIRRAIALQEKVDTIVVSKAIGQSLNVQVVPDSEHCRECDSTKSEAIVVVECSNAPQRDEREEKEEQLVLGERGDTTTGTMVEQRDLSVRNANHMTEEESDHCIVTVGDSRVENMEGVDQPIELPAANWRDPPIGDEPQTMNGDLHAYEEKDDLRAESETGSSLNPESLIEAVKENEQEDVANAGEARERDSDRSERETKEEKNKELLERERETKKERNKELLERMVEDNEKMMALMAELFERNERQTRLLSSLSQRVEQLAKAFVCDELRGKKKRQACGGGTGGSDTFLDSKK